MQNKAIIILITVLFLAFMTTSAFAWRSVRTGKWNFEKAWMAYTSQQLDKAVGYFETSAASFAEALAADPPSKSARFASNLTMAGMAFYYAGRYDECIDAMTIARKKENRVWEAYLFIGLSHGRKGDQTKAVEYLDLYLKSLPSQRNLSATVTSQIKALSEGKTSLDEALTAVDRATQMQFIHNISLNRSPRSSNPAIERCSGAYWWRKNNAPCFATGYGLTSM